MKKKSVTWKHVLVFLIALLLLVGICSLLVNDPASLGKTLLMLSLIGAGILFLYKLFSPTPSPYQKNRPRPHKNRKRKRPSHLHVINGGRKGRR